MPAITLPCARRETTLHWSVGATPGMGGKRGWGRGGWGWDVRVAWVPVLNIASRWARADTRVEWHPADGPMEAPPRRRAVAWVGGAWDHRSKIVWDRYQGYENRPDIDEDDTRHFRHRHREELAEWIRSNRGAKITVTGHSWGAAPAAHVVAAGTIGTDMLRAGGRTGGQRHGRDAARALGGFGRGQAHRLMSGSVSDLGPQP